MGAASLASCACIQARFFSHFLLQWGRQMDGRRPVVCCPPSIHFTAKFNDWPLRFRKDAAFVTDEELQIV